MQIISTNIKAVGLPDSVQRHCILPGQNPSKALQNLSGAHGDQAGVGISIELSKQGRIQAIALSSAEQVVLIPVPKNGYQHLKSIEGMLNDSSKPLCGFSMAELAIHIRGALNMNVVGFNLLDKEGKKSTPAGVIKDVLKVEIDSFAINKLWDDYLADDNYHALTLRAWFSGLIAKNMTFEIEQSQKLRTDLLTPKELVVLYRMQVQISLLAAAECKIVENDFSKVDRSEDGAVIIHNSRFKTRLRRSEKTVIVMTDNRGKEHQGRAKGVEGKKSTVVPIKNALSLRIKGIKIMGKEELTNAEIARDEYVLFLLQGKRILSESSFIRHLWFPNASAFRVKTVERALRMTGDLNPSQANAVEAMVGTSRPIVIVQGPPGTGKTSTISAAAGIWNQQRACVWIAAQSNVGVKNIAEKLCKKDVPFKLIVSKDFHFEWHEHIYEKIQSSVVRSDQLPDNKKGVNALFAGIQIILCTLSMLSNPLLHQSGLMKLIPIHHLVVDEASQINVFDYMHLFSRFKDLKKACFFGDPKQLPPYGKSDAPGLQCIFDIKHFKSQTYFLDTQYRMPTPIGAFISSNVYSNRLQSRHDIQTSTCLAFIDVAQGHEESVGKSWKNMREVHMIESLIQKYYKHKRFCVITPYDAQRNVIQQHLKGANLPWENIFNVDSFQGNEEEYVLISVVRTSRPGFLKSLERLNVMLTRCKFGMVIVTNKAFMHRGDVKKTLLGKLCSHWEILAKNEGHNAWVDWRAVASQKCSLPGS